MSTTSASPQLPAAEIRRVARQLVLPGFGMAEQQALFGSHILVVGAGGLGCPIIQQLAAAGVGRMTIIDSDTVDESNLQRQVLFSYADIGKAKAQCAAARVQELAPLCTTTALVDRLDHSNIMDLVESVDIVLDGSDNFDTKYLVADACELSSTPLIWGTVLRHQGEVATFHSGMHSSDGRGVGLRDLFPEQLAAADIPNCATAGVLGVTTSIIGGLMASAAIGWLSGLDRTIGHVHSYQAFGPRLRSYTLSADPARPLVTQLPQSPSSAELSTSPEHRTAPGTTTAPEELLAMIRSGDAILVDIREEYEQLLEPFPADLPTVALPGSSLTGSSLTGSSLTGDEHAAGATSPREFFATHANAAAGRATMVITCASGGRSAAFVERYQPLATELGLELVDFPGGRRGLQSH